MKIQGDQYVTELINNRHVIFPGEHLPAFILNFNIHNYFTFFFNSKTQMQTSPHEAKSALFEKLQLFCLTNRSIIFMNKTSKWLLDN